MEAVELQDYMAKTVVLDTSTAFVYIGTLEAVERYFLTLTDVDVHDGSESPTTKEVYVLEARKIGVRKNRTRVRVRLSKVVSISLLDEVIDY